MELKDVILSTLAELEDSKHEMNDEISRSDFKLTTKEEENKIQPKPDQEQTLSSEMMFLVSMRERLLVLFEGFQAPNNTNIEAKVDMTLNFLEYVLVTIDSRVEELEKGNRK